MPKVLDVRLVSRNDTAANWVSMNPILIKGEFGIEIDTKLVKIGDGVTDWNGLEYINMGGGQAATKHFEIIAAENMSDEDAISQATGSSLLNTGDTISIKRLIGGEKYSYTAYVYNVNKWEAMDGNYSSSNIYFADDLVITESIGAIVVPENGSTILSAAGKNLNEVLDSILVERKEPVVEEPSVGIEFVNISTEVEVGTSIVPTYAASFNPGSYSYGPETDVQVNTWTITDNRLTPEISNLPEGSFSEIVLGDSENDIKNYSITAIALHGEGTIPVNNLGEEVVEKQIVAGEKTATTAIELLCYRNYFYGVLSTSSEEEPLTSSVIRSLTAGGPYNSEKVFEIDVSAINGTPKRIIVAYPANTERSGLKSAILPNSFYFDAFSSGDYKLANNVEVEGANGYQAIPYIVYVYEPALIDSTEKHSITLA